MRAVELLARASFQKLGKRIDCSITIVFICKIIFDFHQIAIFQGIVYINILCHGIPHLGIDEVSEGI